jgi:nicotinamide-nucleotide amidase
MKIGFLVIGSEVLDGKISDLNTKILAEFLRTQHLEISEVMVARDDHNSIKNALNVLFKNNEVVLTSGGLGPTKDDITKETLGEYFGRKLLFSEASKKNSQEHNQTFYRNNTGICKRYWYINVVFVPLSNSTGFAPSFFTTHENKILISGPGVPREFGSLLQDHFLNIMKDKLKHDELIDNVVVRTKNIPEEKIFGEVDKTLWEKLEKFGDVSSLPILMGVDIGVKIRAKNNDEMAQKVKAVKDIFENSPVRKNIWHIGTESIEEKIVTLANQKKIRFGFAESATGGLCSHRVTNISGSSQCFMGSVICYDEKVKEHVLGVKRETLDKHTAVSVECAEEMAKGLQTNFSLDIAISVTGYAGPGGGNDKFPVGGVCIGKSVKGEVSTAEPIVLKGDREVLKQRFSQAAMYALLEEVEKFA